MHCDMIKSERVQLDGDQGNSSTDVQLGVLANVPLLAHLAMCNCRTVMDTGKQEHYALHQHFVVGVLSSRFPCTHTI